MVRSVGGFGGQKGREMSVGVLVMSSQNVFLWLPMVYQGLSVLFFITYSINYNRG